MSTMWSVIYDSNKGMMESCPHRENTHTHNHSGHRSRNPKSNIGVFTRGKYNHNPFILLEVLIHESLQARDHAK